MCIQHYTQQNPFQATVELKKLRRNLTGNVLYQVCINYMSSQIWVKIVKAGLQVAKTPSGKIKYIL
jgi:hypothetical protein